MVGMNNVKHPMYRGKILRNGKTTTGRRRWPCGSCRATDDDTDLLCRTYSANPKREDRGPKWGDRLVREEPFYKNPWSFLLD